MGTAKWRSLETMSVPELAEEDFHYFREHVAARAGIFLKPGKTDLVKTRLAVRLREKGFDSFRDYRLHLETLAPNDPEWQTFVNQLTTNKTDFFREPRHFDFLLQDALSSFLRGSERVFKIWSAASSTGEEAYTLAMVLGRALPEGREARILATDVDTDVLARGRNAVYPLSKRTEIPTAHQSAIEVGRGSAAGWFRIKGDVKGRVHFRRHNLIECETPQEGPFHVVFCRNVFIYFDRLTIQTVADNLFQATRKGGHLLIGHSESLQGVSHRWKMVGPSCFRKDVD